MTSILESVTIRAEIEAVFDLICRVEEFPLYEDFLTEVRKINHRRYRWVALAHGITLSWDAVITECRRPYRLAWRTVRGFQNSGAYTLTRSAVSIRLEYHLPRQFLETLTAPLADRLTHSLAAQILARVKRKLESKANKSGTGAPPPVTTPSNHGYSAQADR